MFYDLFYKGEIVTTGFILYEVLAFDGDTVTLRLLHSDTIKLVHAPFRLIHVADSKDKLQCAH